MFELLWESQIDTENTLLRAPYRISPWAVGIQENVMAFPSMPKAKYL